MTTKRTNENRSPVKDVYIETNIKYSGPPFSCENLFSFANRTKRPIKIFDALSLVGQSTSIIIQICGFLAVSNWGEI